MARVQPGPGVRREALAAITHVEPLVAVTWEAPQARYRWLGIATTVAEAVTWRLNEHAGATRLSARVQASFPRGARGRVTEWLFTHVLRGVAKDRAHAHTELRYLKRTVEATTLQS